MLKDHDLAGGAEGGVEVLQKELFRAGVGVEGKVEGGDGIALQQAPGRHTAGRLSEGEMPPGAAAAGEENDVAGGGTLGAQHKGAAHGPHDAFHKGVLPQHRLLYFLGQPLKAAQMLRARICRAPGQQAVGLHIPQHPAAVFQRIPRGGVLILEGRFLLFEHLVQLFLLGQQGGVEVGQGPGRFCLRLRIGRRVCRGGLETPSRPENAVHQAFPIVGVCHGTALRVCFFQYIPFWEVWQEKA